MQLFTVSWGINFKSHGTYCTFLLPCCRSMEMPPKVSLPIPNGDACTFGMGGYSMSSGTHLCSSSLAANSYFVSWRVGGEEKIRSSRKVNSTPYNQCAKGHLRTTTRWMNNHLTQV